MDVNMWIEVDINEIAAINANSPIHKISPIQTINGDWVVLDDILIEPLFSHAHAYLQSCETLILAEFPTPTLPI